MHQPTLRVLRVLEYVAADGGKRLADYSKALSIPKSTLLPILQTLCDQRYLRRDPADRYLAGSALFSLGACLPGCFPFLRFVRDELRALVEEVGETCYCGVLEDGNVLYLDKAESTQPLRMLTSIGKRLPAYATGLGKALLCGRTEAELRALYPDGLKPLTEHTVTDYSVLARQVSQVRTEGYAWEREESTPHIACFAVPVKKHTAVVAAISVAIPLFRYEEAQRERIIASLKEHGERIGRMMESTDAHFGDGF